MAFDLGKNNGRKKRIISDINITPLVDVLLVLLIIFMVAAPMMTGGVNVDLPNGANSENNKITSLVVSVKRDSSIFLQESQISERELVKKLLELSNGDTENQIQVKADHGLDYGKVMEIVRLINLAGFKKVVLVTQLSQ